MQRYREGTPLPSLFFFAIIFGESMILFLTSFRKGILMHHFRLQTIGMTFFILIMTMNAGFTEPENTERRYPQAEIPSFWKSTIADVNDTLAAVKRGQTQIIDTSPGGHSIALVAYGAKPSFHRQANYQSATGARDPRYFADKPEETPPTVFILGPVHGQEIENIVGTLNLIQVAETGKDFRGKEWPRLSENIGKIRLIVVPLANPDGRLRCPYDSFVGIPAEEMTRVGQGTRKDGSLYGWPGAKAIHPMKGDVGFLGAYFNNDGINLMHDDFFAPMATITQALMQIAREEAPDYLLLLHSHENSPAMISTDFVPWYCKKIESRFAERLIERYKQAGLPTGGPLQPEIDGETYPPPSFNLTSALHHVCGGVAMLFECCHGLSGNHATVATHDQILDTELMLFDELIQFAVDFPRPEKNPSLGN